MGLARAFSIVSFNTLISRIFGFFRDVLMAGIVGTSVISDAFFIALKFPNMFRRIFGEGALNIAFLPIYTEIHKKEGAFDSREFASLTLSNLVLVLIPLCLICMILMPFILTVVAPGYLDDPVQQVRTVFYARITFPYLFFISLTSLFGAILNAHKKFMAFSIAPILFNLCLIFGLLFAYIYQLNDEIGVILSSAVVISGLLQCAFLYVWLRVEGIRLQFKWPRLGPKIKRLIKLMAPSIVGAFAMQGQMFIDVFFTSFLVSGSLSFLYYADRIAQLPLGLIGVAMSTVLLPYLSQAIVEGNAIKAKAYFSKSVLASLMLALPASIALMMIPDVILTVLFYRGAFTETSVIATSYALMAYAIGLPAMMLSKCLINIFYAHQNTLLPTKILISVLCINVVLSYILVQTYAHVGIALATGITSWLSMSVLAIFAYRKYGFRIDCMTCVKIFKLLLINMGIAAILYIFKITMSQFDFTHFISGVMVLSILIGSILLVYLSLLLAFGIYDKEQLTAIFKKKKI